MRRESPNFADTAKAKEKLRLLYELYAPKLLCTAKRILKDSRDAEDVVQSAFWRTLYILDEIKNPEEKRTYALLTIIVRNLCYDNLMKKGNLTDFRRAQWDAAYAKSSGPAYLNKEKEKERRASICAMPEKYRMPMLLFYVHRLSVEKIGGVLEIPKALVLVRLLRGRNYVQNELKRLKNKE